MESEKIQEVAFAIILDSGQARTLIHESFQLMRTAHYLEAQERLDQANDALVEAHKAQTNMLQEYASGTKIEMEIIMVHAQDHLMTTMTLKEVALEMLFLYQRGGETVA